VEVRGTVGVRDGYREGDWRQRGSYIKGGTTRYTYASNKTCRLLFYVLCGVRIKTYGLVSSTENIPACYSLALVYRNDDMVAT